MAGTQWHNDVPIYRQLHDRIVEMILEGDLGEDDPLPSVREIAAEHRRWLNGIERMQPVGRDDEFSTANRGLAKLTP